MLRSIPVSPLSCLECSPQTTINGERTSLCGRLAAPVKPADRHAAVGKDVHAQLFTGNVWANTHARTRTYTHRNAHMRARAHAHTHAHTL
eukprot:3547076-Pleurochrysis_carterae.AAC.1